MNGLEPVESRLWDALKDVQDPEFPISIVDMGLVVAVEARDGRANVQITLTSMGCPGLDMIIDDIRSRLMHEPAVNEVAVEVVWDPIWTKDRLSEDGKMAMREWGISL